MVSNNFKRTWKSMEWIVYFALVLALVTNLTIGAFLSSNIQVMLWVFFFLLVIPTAICSIISRRPN